MMDIASASGTGDPGSNPARVYGSSGNMTMQLCITDLIHIVCALKREIKVFAQKYIHIPPKVTNICNCKYLYLAQFTFLLLLINVGHVF
jgi:hypothetical protein